MDLYLVAKLGHFIAIALGVGGAIASDTLFLRAIKDKKISRDEVALLTKLSSLVWIGLFLFLFSGILFMYVQYAKTGVITYLASEPFRAKLTIFTFLFINAFIFHIKVFPLLSKSDTKERFMSVLRDKAFLFASVGSVSIVSWMTIFVLGTLRSITPKFLTYGETLSLYGCLLVTAIVVSYAVLKRHSSK